MGLVSRSPIEVIPPAPHDSYDPHYAAQLWVKWTSTFVLVALLWRFRRGLLMLGWLMPAATVAAAAMVVLGPSETLTRAEHSA
jgi:hypothetical protein